MKHLLWVVGLAVLIPGIMTWESNRILAIALFAVSLILLAIFFFMMFRDEGKQDISITKF
jgi:preprotein translocase subunit YajC